MCENLHWTWSWSSTSSAPSVHASFPKHAILFDPEALSCLDDEGVSAPDLLEGEEVEVSQLVPRKVEVLPHPSVKVVPDGPPVLCAPLSARASVSYLPHILSWSSETMSGPMWACYTIYNRIVVASDTLLYRPGLSCQGAGVSPGVGGVDAGQTSCLSTLLETWLSSSTCSLPPVHWR